MKSLNLADWSKISQDKKTTKLKHKNGHFMVLAHNALPKIQMEALKRIKFADGGDVSSDNSDNTPAPAPVTVNVGTAAQQPPQMQTQDQPNINPIKPPSVPTNLPPVIDKEGQFSPAGVQQMGMAGEKLGSQVQAAEAKAMDPVYGYAAQGSANQQKYIADITNQLQNKADDFAKFHAENPLKENAYLENMGAGRKMGTALGLLFSGAGSGLSGQPNLAYDFLNKQIDRNIDAQKNRFDQAKTVFGAYHTLFGDQTVASNLARVHQIDYVDNMGKQIAAKMGTPQAAAALMQLQSKTLPERSKLIGDSAVRMSVLPGSHSQGVPTEGIPGQDQGQQPGTSAPPPQPQGDQGSFGYNKSGIQNASFSPGQQAQAPAPQKQQEDNEFKILKPGAEDRVNDIFKYDRTISPEIKQKINDQMTGAAQAEKALSRLDNEKIFENLVQDTRSGGMMNRYLRNLTPTSYGALGAAAGAATGNPGIGASIGSAVGHLIPSTEINRKFETDQQKLAGIISSALAGRGDMFVNEAIRKFTPEYGDSPLLLKDKIRGLKEYIIDHTPSDALEGKSVGLAYPRKR